MEEAPLERRTGCKRARRATAVSMAMRAVLVVLLAAPHVPSCEALKLASISEERGHLGVGLLRAVEVVRGRYERAWALVSAAEPTAEDLDAALELLQANAKQWESLEPAVKLWTERENEAARHSGGGSSIKTTESTTKSNKHASEHHHRSSTGASEAADGKGGQQQQQQQQEERAPGTPGASDTTSRIYEEAASLLAHNRAVLGQALARSGHPDRGIAELEVACPEILEYQQNAQGRRDSKSWLHCFANLADMYKTQKRFEEASSLLARMPWLPSPQGAATTGDESAPPSPGSPADAGDGNGNSGDILTVPLGTSQAVAGSGNDALEDTNGAERTAAEDSAGLKSPSPDQNPADENSGDVTNAEDPATPGSPSKSGSGGGGRSDAPPPRGAGAARVAGLNKAAAAASAAAAAESAAAAAGAVETGAEAAARAVVERHAEAMRASMNELVGELAVTTATRPSSSQDWLNSRVVAAEEVLAAVRSGLLSVAATPEQATGGVGDSATDTVADVPTMVVGAPGHADILREASHYLSAIKGVAAQGWAYVDNELHRMERHPAQAVKPGFQSRREVIHTFRYLLVKARQYASENQSQGSRTMASGTASSQAGSGSGSRWRRKDRGGRKASTSSKAPRKGSAARGKSSSRSDGDPSSTDNDGVLTLFIGAGIALLVAAVSSGGGKGQGRRREAERQRTATRAAKTVGSYVEPPQRTAVAALMFHLWGNLKRSGLVVSSHAISTANLSRTLLFTAWASFFERLRAARSSAGSRRAVSGAKATMSSLKKSAGGAQNNSNNKQRSKKNVKKAAAAPARLLVRGDTAMVTPPASPPAASQSGVQQKFAAAPAADVVPVSTPVETRDVEVTETTETKTETAAPARKPAKTVTKSVGANGNTAASGRATTAAAAAAAAAPVATAAVQAAAEKSAGVPFPDVMTAEQVQAMVEEDERAWEQARLSEKLHSRATAAAAAAAATAAAAAASPPATVVTAVETGVEEAGWSEVGGASSRGRAGAGGARGRVLSIRNVRAAAQAARTSSPGSDPATTTSASSSDSSEGCKEKSSHAQAMSRVSGRQGGRAVQGNTRGTTLPRAGTKPAWGGGGAATQTRGGALRVEQARRTMAARDSDQAATRTAARASHAARAASRTATQQSVSGNGKERSIAGVAQKMPVSGGGGMERGSLAKGTSASALRPVSAPVAAAPAARTQAVSASSPRQPLQAEVLACEGSESETTGKNAEDEVPRATPAQPAAWTNTPSHPLGMQPEPTPLPPASEPPCPPPQHQQHWQRQQQREQHQQRQHQHHNQHHHQHHQHQHFFHQQEPPLMAMSAPVPHQHDVSHHYPPLSSLPPQAHHHGQAPPPQQQQQQEVIMPQYIPPSEEAFPPPSALMSVPAAANTAASATHAMAFPIHPAHVPALPPSPGGGLVAGVHPHFHARDGSFDSPASGGGGFTPDAAVLAPPQAMVLPPPYEQQQQQQPGRFSPPTLQVVPVEDVGGGVVSPMYGQQGQGPSSSGGFLPNGTVGGGSDEGEAFEALMNAIRWQVEYYFSADNLVTDSYLRGLMDPEGFVAVSKIIVFNRVRSMTSDPTLVVAAMRRSNELEILEQDHTGEARVRTRHSPLHWTREQVPPVDVPSPLAHHEEQHQEEEPCEQEVEEEEEEEHHITFGNVAEVIGREDSPPVSVSVEQERTYSRD